MLKKTITYENFNGESVTEDFYFHLSEPEIIEMQIGAPEGDFSEYLKKIVASKDNATIFAQFKIIILKSYGEKSEDGKRFIKSEEISTGFSQTQAFNDLIMELISDEKEAEEFVRGILPMNLMEEYDENKRKAQELVNAAIPSTTTPVPKP